MAVSKLWNKTKVSFLNPNCIYNTARIINYAISTSTRWLDFHLFTPASNVVINHACSRCKSRECESMLSWQGKRQVLERCIELILKLLFEIFFWHHMFVWHPLLFDFVIPNGTIFSLRRWTKISATSTVALNNFQIVNMAFRPQKERRKITLRTLYVIGSKIKPACHCASQQFVDPFSQHAL